MNLCIDIGNSSEKLSIFQDGHQLLFLRSAELDDHVIDDVLEEFPATQGIVSSTRKTDRQLIQSLQSRMKLLILDHSTPVPINNCYESPETLGRDRIAAVVAANCLYPGQHNLVVDAGTCITADFIDSSSNYLGGNISPGISMRLRAMHEFTERLPLISNAYHEEILGKNTAMALQNGALRGAIWEITALEHDISAQFGPHNVILTGGDSKYFEDHVNFKIFAHSNLVHVGLNEILEYNS